MSYVQAFREIVEVHDKDRKGNGKGSMLQHELTKVPCVRLPSLLSGHKYFPNKRKRRRVGSLQFAHSKNIINNNLNKCNYYSILPETDENSE